MSRIRSRNGLEVIINQYCACTGVAPDGKIDTARW